MAHDKAIEHGREHREPYRRAKAADRTCRNHGSCSYCRGNRLYKALKAEAKAKQKEREGNDND